MGGFSEDNLLCIDQRGFKTIIQAEAADFLTPAQTMLNATVKSISYSSDGVEVTLVDGTKLEADYALVTFSVGVLQNDDVAFKPALPDWKQEAIQSITMVKHSSELDSVSLLIYFCRPPIRKYSFSLPTISGSTLR